MIGKTRSHILLAALAVLTTAPSGAHLALAQPTSNAQILTSKESELLEAQGIDRLIDIWRKSMRESGDSLKALDNANRGIDLDAVWRKSVDGVFGGDGLARKLAQQQAATLSDSEAREVIAFRRSPLGVKLTAAEVTSPFPEAKLGDQKFMMGELEKAKRVIEKDKVRSKILADMLQAVGGGALQAELLMTISRGMAIGMTLATPEGQVRPSEADIVQIMEAERPKFVQLMKAIAIPSFALTYRHLNNTELLAYIKHLQSPVGKKNIAVLVKSFASILNQASIEMGRAFGKELNAQRS